MLDATKEMVVAYYLGAATLEVNTLTQKDTDRLTKAIAVFLNISEDEARRKTVSFLLDLQPLLMELNIDPND